MREISREIDEQINSVRRELNNLESIGMLQSEARDKKKYYRVNEEFGLHNELRSLILKSRLTMERQFIQSIADLGSIQYLALTGYFVNDNDSLVDLFLVGKVNRTKLKTLLNKFQKNFGRQIRFTIMTKDEYAYRHDVTDKFLYEILNGRKLVLVDKLGA